MSHTTSSQHSAARAHVMYIARTSMIGEHARAVCTCHVHEAGCAHEKRVKSQFAHDLKAKRHLPSGQFVTSHLTGRNLANQGRNLAFLPRNLATSFVTSQRQLNAGKDLRQLARLRPHFPMLARTRVRPRTRAGMYALRT